MPPSRERILECLAVLDRNAVPAAAYRTVREAMADPQLAHREAFAEVSDASGVFKVLNPPFRMSESATSAGPRAPALGEHTREVLASLDLSDKELDALAAQGVIKMQS